MSGSQASQGLLNACKATETPDIKNYNEKEIQEGRKTLTEAIRSSKPSSTLHVPYSYLQFITDDFNFDRLLGCGGFGSVYDGYDKEIHFKVAIKVLRSDLFGQKYKNIFQKEVEKLHQLRHPNIIRLLGSFYDKNQMCMVLERAYGGAVSSILSVEARRSMFSPAARLYVAQCLVSAVSYLHQKNIFHRDIKTENLCMLYENWVENSHAVLTDFGIAAEVSNVDIGASMTSVSGTEEYMAPEYRMNRKFTPKSEVFSIGAVITLLLTADFSLIKRGWVDCSKDQLITKVDNSGGFWKSKVLTDLVDLLRSCSSSNPDLRPSIAELLEKVYSLRRFDGAFDELPDPLKSRIAKHCQSAKRTEGLCKIAAAHTCIMCGCKTSRGIACKKNHFICSVATCLDSVARNHMGKELISCPELTCTEGFCIADLYEYVNADVYAMLVKASDKTAEYEITFKDMMDALFDLQKEIKELKQTGRSGVLDINEKLSYLIKGQDDLRELNEKARLENIKNLTELANSIHEQEKYLNEKRERLEKQLESWCDDRISTKKELETIVQKLEALSLQHAEGVKLLASGQLQCPRLFVLIPDCAYGTKFRNNCFYKTYRLHFICPSDYSLVKTAVTLKKPNKWYGMVAPVMKYAVLTLRLLIISYGVPIPADWSYLIPGADSLKSIFDESMSQMEMILGELNELQDVVDSSYNNLNGANVIESIRKCESEITSEAYGAIAVEAYKPENKGWMDVMEIASYGDCFEWVKKSNVQAWKAKMKTEMGSK